MWKIPTLTDLSSLTLSLHNVLWFLPTDLLARQPLSGDGSMDVLHPHDVALPGYQGHQINWSERRCADGFVETCRRPLFLVLIFLLFFLLVPYLKTI